MAYTTQAATFDHFGRSDQAEATRAQLDAIARVLDSAFRIPGTPVRVGADAILTFIPGVGTLVSKGVSAYLILEARRFGVPNDALLRMIGNVGVDFVLGSIPVVGWFADIVYRANLRNMALLRAHLDVMHPPRVIDGVAVEVVENGR
jgi:hypothetical protein